MADANAGTIVAWLKMEISNFLAGTRQATAAMGQVQAAAGATEKKMGLLGKAVAGVTAAFAVQKVIQFGTALWKVGLEVEAAEARFKSMFGTADTELRQWTENNARAFGTGADDLRGYVANVTNVLRGLNLTTEQAGRQSTVILELAKAWSAYWGGTRSIEDITGVLTKAMAGQTRGLVELGMKITDASLAAEVAKLGLSDLTGVAKDQAEAVARLNVLYGLSADALKVEKEMAEGALGAQRDLEAAIDQAKDAMGAMVLATAPLISALAKLGSIPIMGGSVMGALAGGMMFGVPGAVIGGTLGGVAQLASYYEPGQGASYLAGQLELQNALMKGQIDPTKALALQTMDLGDAFEMAGTTASNLTGALLGVTAALSGGVVGGVGGWLQESGRRFIASARNVLGEHVGVTERMAGGVGGWLQESGRRFIASALNVLGEHAGITERMAGQTILDKAKIRRALTQPFDEAFRETTRIIREGFGAIGNLFVTFEIPEISKGEIAQNLLDWQEAQNDVAELMAALGAAGLASYGAALAAGLSPAQLAAIAAVWGGDLAYIQSLMPQYGPGGMLYQGRTYFGGGVDQPGSVGDYSASSYATGHPSSGGGGPATPADPGWGMGGMGRLGGGKGGDINVYVGQAVGDETSIERMVTTAIRRARQRGNVRYYT